jgi:uncharacterized membrane protein
VQVMPADFTAIGRMLPFILPVLLIELGLMVFALVDVVKRKRVRGDNKVVWILIIILVNLIGPIIYLAIGRKEDEVDSDQD